MCAGARALRPLRVPATVARRTSSPLAPAPGCNKTLLALLILLAQGGLQQAILPPTMVVCSVPGTVMPDCLDRHHPPRGCVIAVLPRAPADPAPQIRMKRGLRRKL